jgi:hypothetical protein
MKKSLRNFLMAGGLLFLAISAAQAAGFLTNGLPPAGGSQYPTTVPLTGNELVPADTALPFGLNPASESVSTGQLWTFLVVPQATSASNTSSFTATTGQVAPTSAAGARNLGLLLTGVTSTTQTLTTPGATNVYAALALTPGATAASEVGQQWILRISNESTASWTIAPGAGVTITGSTTAVGSSAREYLATMASATALTLVDIGN